MKCFRWLTRIPPLPLGPIGLWDAVRVNGHTSHRTAGSNSSAAKEATKFKQMWTKTFDCTAEGSHDTTHGSWTDLREAELEEGFNTDRPNRPKLPVALVLTSSEAQVGGVYNLLELMQHQVSFPMSLSRRLCKRSPTQRSEVDIKQPCRHL